MLSPNSKLSSALGTVAVLAWLFAIVSTPLRAEPAHPAADTNALVEPNGGSEAIVRLPSNLANLDYSEYDQLLRSHVTTSGWVDYPSLVDDHAALERFIRQLGDASFSNLKTRRDQLTFWINAYNAFTLADVLATVYGKHQSVQQVSGFFNGRKHFVAGEKLTLDEIETRGRAFRDPRLHFAIVCASSSCPKLQPFAYTSAELDTQLDQVTREFFADSDRGIRYNSGTKSLYVSPILEWYAGDFAGKWTKAGALLAQARAAMSGGELLKFIEKYVPQTTASSMRLNPPTLHYFDYDWSLNSLETHKHSGNREN